ncbi:MAG TPA: acyloxyacyl hydrolase [Vicinamibacterales bacterium]|nr:acyloxyacyl hydrolase [Vicinamibacterales bacterium]
MLVLAATLLGVNRSLPVQAQGGPSSGGVTVEFNATVGGGVAQSVFNSAGDRQILTTGLAVGWFLGEPPPPGQKPGGFEILIELVPTLVVYQSEPVWGAGIMPVAFRWTSRRQGVAPYIEWAGGFLNMRGAVPEGTAQRNFMTHLGTGLRIPVRGAAELLVAYRLHHISNGNTVDRNPGVNSHTVQMGVAWRPIR